MTKQNKQSLIERIEDMKIHAESSYVEEFDIEVARQSMKIIKELEAIISIQRDFIAQCDIFYCSVNADLSTKIFCEKLSERANKILEKSDKMMNGGEDE